MGSFSRFFGTFAPRGIGAMILAGALIPCLGADLLTKSTTTDTKGAFKIVFEQLETLRKDTDNQAKSIETVKIKVFEMSKELADLKNQYATKEDVTTVRNRFQESSEKTAAQEEAARKLSVQLTQLEDKLRQTGAAVEAMKKDVDASADRGRADARTATDALRGETKETLNALRGEAKENLNALRAETKSYLNGTLRSYLDNALKSARARESQLTELRKRDPQTADTVDVYLAIVQSERTSLQNALDNLSKKAYAAETESQNPK